MWDHCMAIFSKTHGHVLARAAEWSKRLGAWHRVKNLPFWRGEGELKWRGGHWGCLRLPGLVFGAQQGLRLPTAGPSSGCPAPQLILGTSRWGQVPADGTPGCVAQPSASQKPPEMAAWCSRLRLGAGAGCSPGGLLPQPPAAPLQVLPQPLHGPGVLGARMQGCGFSPDPGTAGEAAHRGASFHPPAVGSPLRLQCQVRSHLQGLQITSQPCSQMAQKHGNGRKNP